MNNEESDYSFPNYNEEIPRPMDEEDSSFSKWQLDPENFLDNITKNLQGKQKNSDGEWSLPDGARPKMNERGIQDIVSSLRLAIFHKFTRLGILEEKTIKRICYVRGHILLNLLISKHREYDIDVRDIPTIHDDIMTAVQVYLSSAKDGRTLSGFQKIFRVFEKSGDNQKDNDVGLIGSFIGKSKGGK